MAVKLRSHHPVPDRFFRGQEPTELTYMVAIRLGDLIQAGTPEEREWARATFQRLRGEQLAADDVEAIPLTFS